MHRILHKMFLTPIAIAFVIFGLIAPASADTRSVSVDPVEVAGQIDVLSIACKGAVSEGDQVAGCRWSQTDDVRAYQLWRIVDRGERELVATYDATTNVARDDVPDDAVVVRYAVLALGADGEIIGQSRVARVRYRSQTRG